MIKLAIFDLGETLINYQGLALDWSEHYEPALRQVFEGFGIPIDENKLDIASSILRKYNTRINPRNEEVTAEEIFSAILEQIGINQDYRDRTIERFFNYFQRRAEPNENAEKILLNLKSAGIRVAVLTDVPYGMPKNLVLKDLELIIKYIDLVITSCDAGFRKPSSEGVEMILKYFQIGKDEAVYIGNEMKDIDLAKNYGVKSILLNRSENVPNWEQTFTICSLSEIADLLKS